MGSPGPNFTAAEPWAGHALEMRRSAGASSGLAGLSGTTTPTLLQLALRTSGLCTGCTAWWLALMRPRGMGLMMWWQALHRQPTSISLGATARADELNGLVTAKEDAKLKFRICP